MQSPGPIELGGSQASANAASIWPILQFGIPLRSRIESRVLDKNSPTKSANSRPVPYKDLDGGLHPGSLSAVTLGCGGLAKKADSPAHRARGAFLTSLLASGLELRPPSGIQARVQRWGRKHSKASLSCTRGPISSYSWDFLRKEKAHKMCCSKQVLANYRKKSAPEPLGPGLLSPYPGHRVWSRLRSGWGRGAVRGV